MVQLVATDIEGKRAESFDITLPINQVHRFFGDLYSLGGKTDYFKGICLYGTRHCLSEEELKIQDDYVNRSSDPVVRLLAASQTNIFGLMWRGYLVVHPLRTSFGRLRLRLKGQGIIIKPKHELGVLIGRQSVRIKAEAEKKYMRSTHGEELGIPYWLARCNVAIQSDEPLKPPETLDKLVDFLHTDRLEMDNRPYSQIYGVIFPKSDRKEG